MSGVPALRQFASHATSRYAEYIEVVDGVLRSSDEPFSYEGDYYRTTDAVLAPPPPQVPRPPLVGITEFVVMWPGDERQGLIERLAALIASLRNA